MAPDDEQYTREDLVKQLHCLADELGHSPTISELKNTEGYPPVRRFLEAFGTWNAAKKAAGLETYRKEGRGDSYSYTELLDRLRRLARDTEGPVTIQDANESDVCPSAVTYQRRFGSWNMAKKAAGLKTVEADDTPAQYTDEELCELLRSLAAEVDGPLTVRDVEEADGYPDHTTFERRFGSWNKAKQAAGLTPIEKSQGRRGHTYSDDELLQLLRDRATDVERSLTKADIDDAEDYPSSSTFVRRFGSWTAAKKQAGLKPDSNA